MTDIRQNNHLELLSLICRFYLYTVYQISHELFQNVVVISLTMDDQEKLLNDDEEDLDKEVESCLTGVSSSISGYAGSVSSPSTCSFYSTATEGQYSDVGDTNDLTDTESFYSSRTMVLTDTDTDTHSYLSVDTLTGREDDLDDNSTVMDNDDDQHNVRSRER